MITLTSRINSHLNAADKIVDDTARSTVALCPKHLRSQIQHIDAAQHLLHAAEFMHQAAYEVAKGAPADCPQVAMYIDFGNRKAKQAQDLMTAKTAEV